MADGGVAVTSLRPVYLDHVHPAGEVGEVGGEVDEVEREEDSGDEEQCCVKRDQECETR